MKTKALHFICFFIFSFFLLTSCEEEEKNSLEVSVAELTLSSDANSGTFTVIGSQSWTITAADDWCTVTPKTGEFRKDIVVRAKANDTQKSRQTVLTVTSGSLTREVKVMQPESSIAVSPLSLIFPAEGDTLEVSITSESTEWTINVSADEALKIMPMSGTGSAKLTVILAENDSRKAKSLKFSVNYNKVLKQEVTIEQAGGANKAPGVPSLNYPQNNASNVFVVPEFSWTAVIDPDGDKVRYSILYSEDNTKWEELPSTATVRYMLNKPLEKTTLYYWKVRAYDLSGGEAFSDVYQFTTDNSTVKADGFYERYTGGLPMDGPIPIIFMGDGFVASDYMEGGLFDKKIDEGIEAFFDVEPYITYRDQFKVYKVCVYSQESGASRWDESRNTYASKVLTAFDTRYYGDGYTSTFMTANCGKAYDYAKLIPGITEEVLDNTTVVLVVNDPTYSGTCWMSTSGRSCAIVPTCDNRQPYTYKETMVHEAGGHGFGRLADEYIFQGGENRPINASERENLVRWIKNGANANVDTTGDRSLVKWKHFFGVNGYERVKVRSGAQYKSGVWMPEDNSAMRSMRTPYYNAPSREAIVKRIKKNLGVSYSFKDFLSKDVIPNASEVRSSTNEQNVKHTSPQLYVPEVSYK